MTRWMRWTCTVEGCHWHVDDHRTTAPGSLPVRGVKGPLPPASMAEAVRRAKRSEHGAPGAIREHFVLAHGVPVVEVGPEHFRGGWTGISSP